MANSSVSTGFWVVAALALVWNLLGLAAFGMHVNMDAAKLAELSQAEQDLYNAQPTWYLGAFGLAVIAGVIGSIGLLLRKKWAVPVFALSLLGIIAQQVYMFFLSDTFQVMGQNAMAMPLLILLVAIFLLWFAQNSTHKGYLD